MVGDALDIAVVLDPGQSFALTVLLPLGTTGPGVVLWR
jgi:hypothetical protein